MIAGSPLALEEPVRRSSMARTGAGSGRGVSSNTTSELTVDGAKSRGWCRRRHLLR